MPRPRPTELMPALGQQSLPFHGSPPRAIHPWLNGSIFFWEGWEWEDSRSRARAAFWKVSVDRPLAALGHTPGAVEQWWQVTTDQRRSPDLPWWPTLSEYAFTRQEAERKLEVMGRMALRNCDRIVLSPARCPWRTLVPDPYSPTREWVYFAQLGVDGPIKIGISRNPLDRMTTLRVGQPQPVRLLYAIEGSRKSEAWWHGRFAEFRLYGEWFSPSPRLLQEVFAHSEVMYPGAVELLELTDCTLAISREESRLLAQARASSGGG